MMLTRQVAVIPTATVRTPLPTMQLAPVVTLTKETVACAPGDEFCEGTSERWVATDPAKEPLVTSPPNPIPDSATSAGGGGMIEIPGICPDGTAGQAGLPCPGGGTAIAQELCWDGSSRPAGTCPPQARTASPAGSQGPSPLLVGGAVVGFSALLLFMLRRRDRKV